MNGQVVDMGNIASALSSASGDLTLLIRKLRPHSPTPSHPPHPHSGLVRLVTGGRGVVQAHKQAFSSHPHVLLYLTLNTKEEDPPDKDIIYQFSLGQSETIRRLVSLRGLFLTLSDIMSSITTATTSW